MSQPWYIRFGRWLCEKAGHPWVRKSWIYAGCYHRECRVCNRIVSEPLKENTNDDA